VSVVTTLKKNSNISSVPLLLICLPTSSSTAEWHIFGHDPQHTGVAGESVYYLFEAMKNEN
jgi:hypothetical protein